MSSEKDTIEQLRANLLNYGYHFPSCPCYSPMVGKWTDYSHQTKTADELNITKQDGVTTITLKCTCGFEEAFEQALDGLSMADAKRFVKRIKALKGGAK